MNVHVAATVERAPAEFAALAERFAVVGLGYVGLPVAAALAARGASVVGFDIAEGRIGQLRDGVDVTGETDASRLKAPTLALTTDPSQLKGRTFFIVTVPTPVDRENRPDLRPLAAACRTIGPELSRGAVVVFESTVFPGATEEICGPLLAEESGLECGTDFTLGYSPERINPGDREHSLDKIIKVVAGQDDATLDRVAAAYSLVARAGIHRAPSIRIAEAAKVLENIQRDVNIALMNEVALICDRLGLRTRDVLAAAGTKWNFLKFTPGLVGGHCIGVDPYYLTAKAESVGYHPEVILSGRRINDGMGRFIAQKTVKLLAAAGRLSRSTRVGLLGLTFKENVPDVRNSRSVDIVLELRSFGIDPLINDPLASPAVSNEEYGLTISPLERFEYLDALIVAVPHTAYLNDRARIRGTLSPGGVLIDVKSVFSPDQFSGLHYWGL